jgi:rfaE bifunctional protein nucleotidyltransferase chain/domain
VGQVVTQPQLLSELQGRRQKSAQPLRVVFTNGCFDILHVGHARYLNEARALGDLLVVGMNSDASVRQLKGPTRPIQDEGDRSELLASLGAVDYVVIFNDHTPEKLIEALQPNILVKGGDWAIESIVGANFVLSHGGQVKALQFHPGRSTTKLLERIEKR